MSKSIQTILTLLIFSLCATPVFAKQWQLDVANSQLNFISIKKVHIAEIHQFRSIHGRFASQGQLTLDIDLMSVDTHITIRDDRMRKFLFDEDNFATATLRATIDTELIDAIAEGASAKLTVDANLDLHGIEKPLTIEVIVTRLAGAKLSVISA